MSLDANVWCLALLAAFWPAAKVTSAKVEQFPPILNVPIGGNESMFCKFPILQDTAEVSWWKSGQKALIEPDSRNQFNVKKGRGTFTLLNVRYADAGLYYCQVKSQQQIFGNGNGSQLIVLTPPTPLKIIRVEEGSPKSRKLMCKTAAFYPKKLDVFWRKNNMEILTKIETSIHEISEGFYEASSTLEDAQPAQGKMVYTCLVTHETLQVPASFSYIIEEDRNKPLILGCALGGVAIVILIIILNAQALESKHGRCRTT
ncbi:natural cytotoxicity triggering receptor 3 ligand 1-like [Mobula hypostoma]|uniref:natural cytotoxicity triggering receptor 3 ligand 1-like n=1 Tax=Mobula hypostoma TaxID=723540 RepID=UPI002FC27ED8